MLSCLRVAAVGALLLCIGSVGRPPATTDRERAELRGPVKSVSVRWQSNHRDSYGDIEERELGSTTYDEAGALLVAIDITPDFTRERKPERHGPGVTVFRSVMGNATEHYRVDATGNLIERQTWYGDSAAGEPPITERMTYDSAGRMISRETIGEGGRSFGVTRYLRDATGDVVVEEDLPEGQQPPFPRMHYTYTHDAQGNWTARYVTRENVPEDAYQYSYAGNLFRTITYF
jgi:hypothetical protein